MTSPRITSIDKMRGLVIILMALDHTRDYFSNAMFSPTDLNQTNAAYFLTRWLTHLCAPTFVFLAGASAFLAAQRWHYHHRQLARYLTGRGITLILLELTVIRFGWTFNWDLRYGIAQVIWALGWSMIALAGFIFLPRYFILFAAIVLIAGHNLFDNVTPEMFGNLAWLWIVLHVPGNIEYLPGYSIYVFYPLIPWVGIMALGYCLGPAFMQPAEVRHISFFRLGIGSILLFLLLRLTNLYGDPHPWSVQNSPIMTVFSILKCEKYPPSSLYSLMTLGAMFVLLAIFESKNNTSRFSYLLMVFGKAPMVFYIAHIFLIHGLAYAVSLFRNLPVEWLVSGSAEKPFPEIPAPEFGFSLPVVYVIWLFVLTLLYPLCSIYNKKN